MKSIIKDKSRKIVVEEYQKMVKDSIERIKRNNHFISKSLEHYIQGLEENIKNAPFKLGYLKNN